MAPITLDELLQDPAWMKGLAVSLVGEEHAADDIVQESLLNVLEMERRGRRVNRSWVATSIHFAASQLRRASLRRRTREEKVAQAEEFDKLLDDRARNERRNLAQHIVALDEPYQTVIILRFFGRMTSEAIAEHQGIPSATVRSHLRRGLQQLRARLEREKGPEWRHSLTVVIGSGLAERGAAAGKTVAAAKIVAVLLLVAVISGTIWTLWSGGSGDVAPRPIDQQAAATEPGDSLDAERDDGTRIETEPFPEDRYTISGRLTDEGGVAAGGVSVRVYRDRDGELVAVASNPLVAGETEADGSFTLTTSTRGPYRLMAHKRGHAPAVRSAVSHREPVEILLRPEAACVGTVRDGEGRAIPGATVTWRGIFRGVDLRRTARTDANGAYRILGIFHPEADREESFQLTQRILAVAPGFGTVASAPQPDSLRDGNLAIDFRLLPEHPLTVRVVDAVTDAPIEGAPVALWIGVPPSVCTTSPDVFAPSTLDPWLQLRLTTDASGRAAFSGVPVWRRGLKRPADKLPPRMICCVGAWPEDRAMTFGHALLGRKETTEITLRCGPRRVIEGRVVEPGGIGIPGAQVRVDLPELGSMPDGLSMDMTVSTDRSGRFVLSPRHIPEGVEGFHLEVAVPGWIPGVVRRVPVVLAAKGATRVPDIEVSARRVIDVHVHDQARSAVPDAVVSSFRTRDREVFVRRADPFGRVRFRVADDQDDELELTFWAPGFVRTVLPIHLEKGSDETTLTVELKEARTLRGRVLHTDGRPLTNVSIFAARSRDAFAGLKRHFVNWIFARPPDILAAVNAHADGRFTLSGLPAGEVHLAFHVLGARGRRLHFMEDVDTDAEDLTVRIPVGVRLAASEDVVIQWVEGAAFDAETGSPIPGVQAQLTDGRINRQAIEAGFGSFVIPGVLPGRYTLVCGAPGYVRSETTVDVRNDAPVIRRFKLRRGAKYRVRVVSPLNQDLSPGTMAFQEVKSRVSVYAAFNGKTTCDEVWLDPNAHYLVWALPHEPGGLGMAHERNGFLLAPKKYKDGVIELPMILMALGRIVLAPSEDGPRSGVITLSSADGKTRNTLRVSSSAPRDAFLFPGTYRAVLKEPGKEPQECTVTAASGEVTKIEF